MTVLITGATGLIGTQLTKLLIEKGYTVNYLTTSKSKITSKPNFIGFYWNPIQGIIDVNCIKNVDVIIHLAGASISKRWTKTYKQEILQSRIQTSQLLLDALKNNSNKVKQIISASGTAIYPESYTTVYNESSTQTDIGFLSDVVSKWEESVDVFKNLNIKVCKLRTGVVFDKNGGALPEIAKPIQYYVGAAMGNGKQMQSWIHIDDLVSMYYFAIQNQLEGVFNAVAPNPVSNSELTIAIAKTIKKPLFLPNIPQFVMKLLLGEMSILLFSSKNLSSEKIQKHGFKFQFTTINSALQNIYK